MLVPTGSLAGRAPVPLALPLILIGSRHSANIRISSSRINRAHALIFQCNGTLVIRDLNTRTGTLVNAVAIQEAQLHGGEHIAIGPFEFQYQPGRALPPLGDPIELIPARLIVEGGQSTATDRRITLVGRSAGSDVVINHESVSTAHAAIFELDGRRFIRDLGSRTGTLVNDRAVHSIEIRPGDSIRIGPATLRYEELAPAEISHGGNGNGNGKHAPSRLAELRGDWAAEDRSARSIPAPAEALSIEPAPGNPRAWGAPSILAPPAEPVLDLALGDPGPPPTVTQGAQSRHDLARFLPAPDEVIAPRPLPPPKAGPSPAARATESFEMPTLPPIAPARIEAAAPMEPDQRPSFLPVPVRHVDHSPLARISRQVAGNTTETHRQPEQWGPLANAVTTLPPTLVPVTSGSRARPRQPNMRDYTPIYFAILAVLIVIAGILLWMYGMPKPRKRAVPADTAVRKADSGKPTATPSPARLPASPAGSSGESKPSPRAAAPR